MRVLVLGNRGMLGHVVERYLKEKGHQVTGWNRNNIDCMNLESIGDALIGRSWDVIINCVGALGPNKDINQQAMLNVVLPRYLSGRKEKIIHISTNCVFQNIGPHAADETPDATFMYGMAKALGELNNDKDLTIRCSITGPELKSDGSGLFDWFVNKTDDEVTGYNNAYWNGVTTLELAKYIEEVIQTDMTGIINYYTKTAASKFRLLEIINDIYNLNKEIILVYGNAHTSLLKGPYYTTKTFQQQFQELKDWY